MRLMLLSTTASNAELFLIYAAMGASYLCAATNIAHNFAAVDNAKRSSVITATFGTHANFMKILPVTWAWVTACLLLRRHLHSHHKLRMRYNIMSLRCGTFSPSYDFPGACTQSR